MWELIGINHMFNYVLAVNSLTCATANGTATELIRTNYLSRKHCYLLHNRIADGVGNVNFGELI